MLKSFKWVSQKKFNIVVRIKQEFYKNNTSYPYLSGDSFARACDVALYGAHKTSYIDLEEANSIFCPSEKLEQFLSEYGKLIKAKVLVLGNSDRDFYELNCDFPPSINAVYLQNSHISNDFFHTLPIGLENLRYGRNGLTSLFNPYKAKQEKLGRILVGPFSPTHPERRELISWGQIQDSRIKFISESLPPKKLAALASGFKFVACPRGNGTDTHRFWETLYRGSIPVVKKSSWSQSITDLGVSLIQLDAWDYSEFCEVSSQFHLRNFHPNKSTVLWMNYWEELFKSYSK